MSKKKEKGTNPAEVPGTPQHAAAAAADGPQKRPRMNVSLRRKGNRQRNRGLWKPVPGELGGGLIRVSPATIRRVTVAREEYERGLRESPAVKSQMVNPKSDGLPEFPARELLRFTCARCFLGWQDPPIFEFEKKGEAGKVVMGEDGEPVMNEFDIDGWSIADQRHFVEEHLLAPIPLVPDLEDDKDPVDNEFFNFMIESMGQVTRAPAEEIARLGEAFRLGRSRLYEEDD